MSPEEIQNAIANAGSQLFRAWKGGTAMVMPENDLNPKGDQIAFQMKLLSDRVTTLEQQIGEIHRYIKGRK